MFSSYYYFYWHVQYLFTLIVFTYTYKCFLSKLAYYIIFSNSYFLLKLCFHHDVYDLMNSVFESAHYKTFQCIFIICFIKILISNFRQLCLQLLGWEFIRHCPKKVMKKIICPSLEFHIKVLSQNSFRFLMEPVNDTRHWGQKWSQIQNYPMLI